MTVDRPANARAAYDFSSVYSGSGAKDEIEPTKLTFRNCIIPMCVRPGRVSLPCPWFEEK